MDYRPVRCSDPKWSVTQRGRMGTVNSWLACSSWPLCGQKEIFQEPHSSCEFSVTYERLFPYTCGCSCARYPNPLFLRSTANNAVASFWLASVIWMPKPLLLNQLCDYLLQYLKVVERKARRKDNQSLSCSIRRKILGGESFGNHPAIGEWL